MRDMMAQIRDVGDGIRGGTYTMTAPIITGGTITGSTINNSAIGGTTAAAGAFTTLSASGVATVSAGTAALPAITTTGDTNTGIFFPAADTIAFTEGGAEAMRIDSSGQLLVGTTSAFAQTTIYKAGSGVQASSPQLTLQNAVVDGNSGDGAGINFANATGAVANIGSSGNGIMFFSNRASTGAGWSERMRITSNGDVCVGRTSSLGAVKFVVEADTTTYNPMTVSNTRSTAATDYSILFYRNGSIVGSVQTSLSATSYVTSSDYRLKENIAPMTGALAKVSALKPVTYNWKVNGSSGQGFIAHELQAVVPDCVTGEKDAVETYTDEDGNEQTRIKPQGVDTSFLVATLTAAIQELKAELDATKAEVQALKGV
jgi:hypothetical protein